MNKNISQYIKNLQRGAGVDRALKIAEKCMMNTNPKNWNDLPAGSIFFPKGPKDVGYRERDLRKLHNWWTNVYYTMKKGTKNAR